MWGTIEKEDFIIDIWFLRRIIFMLRVHMCAHINSIKFMRFDIPEIQNVIRKIRLSIKMPKPFNLSIRGKWLKCMAYPLPNTLNEIK